METKAAAKILLVDDHPENLLALEGLLSGRGYELVKASSGEEALRCALKEEFALVLLDVQMPGLDGFETAALLRQRQGTRSIPIIFLTAAAKSEELVFKGYETGAVDYLSKPFAPAVLRAKVEVFVELYQKRRELKQANQDLQKTNRKLKETQVQLVQAAKMSSLGQLVAGIAHEINNPLAFALSNLFTVEQGLEQIAPQAEPHLSQAAAEKLAKVRARLKDMHLGLERIKDLVLKLRTFSRLDQGEFKTVDIHESIDSVLLFLRHRLKDRIEVEKRYGPVQFLSCYAGELTQAFMNLIVNAVDAIEGEGKITLTTGQEDGMFFFSVQDTGKGMSKAVLERIFEPFFTTKSVGQGTGLGLSISYSIVQTHQGAIEAKSEEGKGAELVVRIPLNLRNPA